MRRTPLSRSSRLRRYASSALGWKAWGADVFCLKFKGNNAVLKLAHELDGVEPGTGRNGKEDEKAEEVSVYLLLCMTICVDLIVWLDAK